MAMRLRLKYFIIILNKPRTNIFWSFQKPLKMHLKISLYLFCFVFLSLQNLLYFWFTLLSKQSSFRKLSSKKKVLHTLIQSTLL